VSCYICPGGIREIRKGYTQAILVKGENGGPYLTATGTLREF
jgi:hypothetical protein